MSNTTGLSLETKRGLAADREWDAYEMGEYRIDETDGWEYTMGESEWTRTIYFAPIDDPDAATDKGHFVVRFSPHSDEVVEAYAMINGNFVGCRPAEAPTP